MDGLPLLLCVLFTLGFGCSKKNGEKDVSPVANASQLQTKFNEAMAEAADRETKDGWLDVDGCDSMLFTGKYSCAALGRVTIEAAEYSASPGRFNRRPTPFCEAGAGSSTSWSRDMGKGLFAYAWCNHDLDALKRHAAYGNANFWKMGEPLGDGRVLYTPAMIGELYEVIYALGGEDNPNRLWPDAYPSGQTDYEAHLQMMSIWLRGEVDSAKKEIDLDISNGMLARVKEHADAEPNCPFYQYMRGVYDSADLSSTTDLLLGDAWGCSYFHSDNRQDDVYLAEWLFAAKLTLKKLGL